MIDEFLSNGGVILRDLHLNMADPVPIPQGHLHKIVQEDNVEVENEQNEQWLNRKRKWNTTTNTNIKINVKPTDTSDTELMEGIDDTANTSNMSVNTNMDYNRNIMLISTAKEHMTEIDKEDDEEGIACDIIFISDEEDNIFDDTVKEDTLGYINSDKELQIVGKTNIYSISNH